MSEANNEKKTDRRKALKYMGGAAAVAEEVRQLQAIDEAFGRVTKHPEVS